MLHALVSGLSWIADKFFEEEKNRKMQNVSTYILKNRSGDQINECGMRVLHMSPTRSYTTRSRF